MGKHSKRDSLNRNMLFIIGTDTGVGKTFVTAAVAARLRELGENVGVCKPFGTGAVLENGSLVCEDTVLLKAASGVDLPYEAITPVVYKTPLAPNWAARIENRPVDVAQGARAVNDLKELYQPFLVEGIGGLMVPLTDDILVLDFIAEFKAPVLLVARLDLGTLNHTLLTLHALKSKKIPVAGIILNGAEETQSATAASTNMDNLGIIQDAPVFGMIPHKPIGSQLSSVIDIVIKGCFGIGDVDCYEPGK
ncbi:dethiobiotin synthase [Planctomycetota bacterium]